MSFKIKIMAIVGTAVFSALFILVISTRQITEHRIELALNKKDVFKQDSSGFDNILKDLQSSYDKGGFNQIIIFLKEQHLDTDVVVVNADGQFITSNSIGFTSATTSLTDFGFLIKSSNGMMEFMVTPSDHPAIMKKDVRIATILRIPKPPINAKDEDLVQSINDNVLTSGLVTALLVFFITYLILVKAMKPLSDIQKTLNDIRNGDDEAIIPVVNADEIGLIADELNQLLISQRLAQKVRQSLLSDITHDVRTPLTGLRCQVETLIDGLKPPTEENLKALLTSLVQLQNLYTDIEHIALTDAQEITLHFEDVNLEKFLEGVCQTYRQIAPNLQINYKAKPSLAHVNVDPNRLQQVIGNVLNNALTAVPINGKINISSEVVDKNAIIIIQDSGDGVALGDAPFIFDRHYRAMVERNPNTAGSGLGLAIALRLMQLMNGTFTLMNPGQQGAKFNITIPLSKKS